MSNPHVVQQGECLASLADQFGFADWRTIWNHPDNADLKQKRKKPGILFPGDIVAIPDFALKEVDCATAKTHRFKLKKRPTTIRIAFEVHGKYKYELRIGSDKFTGAVPDGGKPIEHPIDPSVRDGELLLWPDTGSDDKDRPGLVTYPVAVGSLDPIAEISGVQGVLTNLGYYAGAIDGTAGPDTQVAIQAFQRDRGLDPTGVIDDALRGKLTEVHDG